MTQYAALIYSHDVDWSEPEWAPTMKEYGEFGEANADSIRGGAVLYPTSTATVVRVAGARGGDVVATDGPYAETKEAFTGFYLLEADDLDAAVALVSQIPASWTGGAVELRPLIPRNASQD